MPEDSYQWDFQSRLYYHARSGFYHDPVAGWSYSTREGRYYLFENGIYVPWETPTPTETTHHISPPSPATPDILPDQPVVLPQPTLATPSHDPFTLAKPHLRKQVTTQPPLSPTTSMFLSNVHVVEVDVPSAMVYTSFVATMQKLIILFKQATTPTTANQMCKNNIMLPSSPSPTRTPISDPFVPADPDPIMMQLFDASTLRPTENFREKRNGGSGKPLYFKSATKPHEWRPPWQPLKTAPNATARREWRPPWRMHSVLEDKDDLKGRGVDTTRTASRPVKIHFNTTSFILACIHTSARSHICYCIFAFLPCFLIVS
ncbi:hypothetical protein HanXRQr2_Chr16g0724231 [Helianthus annuus]|uniref:OCRE domain-containing protein n=1 Tax=Helianthus annuus TaxID=4232 RepID=A0A9K3GWZ8_HELAN|nr:hypothetical protein HanXRQr2_Chr16g0724231 [Helianthus annuus]